MHKISPLSSIAACASLIIILNSCSPHSIRCAVYNQSSKPVNLAVKYRTTRWPLFTIFVKEDKRYIFSTQALLLQPGDSLKVARKDHSNHGNTVIKEVAILRHNGRDTLRKLGPSLGKNIVRLENRDF